MPLSIEVEWLNEERSKAKFTIPQPKEWTADSITDLMKILGQARGEMSPVVPNDPPIFQQVDALTDPRWWSNLDEMTEGCLLMFRHPSLGWLPFYLPSHERKKMIEIFQEQERILGEKKQQH